MPSDLALEYARLTLEDFSSRPAEYARLAAQSMPAETQPSGLTSDEMLNLVVKHADAYADLVIAEVAKLSDSLFEADDLAALVVFMRSPAGRRYRQTAPVFGQAIMEAGSTMFYEIGRRYGMEKGAKELNLKRAEAVGSVGGGADS